MLIINNHLLKLSFASAIFMGVVSLSACGLTPTQPQQAPFAEIQNYPSLNSTNVSGTVTQSSGISASESITVYVPDNKNVTNTVVKELSLSSSYTPHTTCQKPLEPYLSYTCTNPRNGWFSLNIPISAQFPVRLKFQGTYGIQDSVLAMDDFDSDLGIIHFDPQSYNHRQKIAIIADLMSAANPIQETQNNPSNIDDNAELGRMELAQGFLKLYNIDDSISEVEFPVFSSLLVDKDGDQKTDLFQYDIVYLNSQSGSELNELSTETKQLLLEFVKQGGELYITSWKYEIDEPGIDQYI